MEASEAEKSSAMSGDLLPLAARPDAEQLFLNVGRPRRLVPLQAAVGEDELCNVNKFVCRLLLQHQLALQDVFSQFSGTDSMSLMELMTALKAFTIVPSLCSRQNAEQVFLAVA